MSENAAPACAICGSVKRMPSVLPWLRAPWGGVSSRSGHEAATRNARRRVKSTTCAASAPPIRAPGPRPADPANDAARTDIAEVRFKSVGRIGVASLQYDKATGRYAELAAIPSFAALRRGYRDDD
jgi:hypothetical protein